MQKASSSPRCGQLATSLLTTQYSGLSSSRSLSSGRSTGWSTAGSQLVSPRARAPRYIGSVASTYNTDHNNYQMRCQYKHAAMVDWNRELVKSDLIKYTFPKNIFQYRYQNLSGTVGVLEGQHAYVEKKVHLKLEGDLFCEVSLLSFSKII